MAGTSICEQAIIDLCRLLFEAHRLCPRLPLQIRGQIEELLCAVYCRMIEESVRWYDPTTPGDVRRLQPNFRGQALIHLLDHQFKHIQPQGIAHWRYDVWRGWLRDPDVESNADELLMDPQVRTAEDVVGWFVWHERRLFPDMRNQTDEE